MTVTSGRNRLLGERIGMGLSGAEAFQELTAAGTTTEGYLAARYGYRLAKQAIPAGEAVSRRYPVLDALYGSCMRMRRRSRVCGGRQDSIRSLSAA